MITIPSQRSLFDIPSDIAYFNCAYNSPLLNDSGKRILSGMALKSHPWERTASNFFDDSETIRSLAADLFGGTSDGYAVVPAASYGISTAARAIEPTLKKGDEILLIDEEFPSNVLPWRSTARESGAAIKTVKTPIDGNWTNAIIRGIDKKVKVVAVSTCHWTNGAYIDLLPISEACNSAGASLIVDATQSLGAMPFSVDIIKPDFMVAAGYKWLLCPYGFGLLYVSEKWREARPLEETWLAREKAEDFTSLVNYSDKYMPGARRFDVGEKCTSTILPGAVAALEQIKAWGVQNIAHSISLINKKIASELLNLGFTLPEDSQRSPHMFGALIPDRYKGNLVSELKMHKIYVSQRGQSVRFAPHLHINEVDIERLLQTLRDIIR